MKLLFLDRLLRTAWGFSRAPKSLRHEVSLGLKGGLSRPFVGSFLRELPRLIAPRFWRWICWTLMSACSMSSRSQPGGLLIWIRLSVLPEEADLRERRRFKLETEVENFTPPD
jgi:hypothetical protein